MSSIRSIEVRTFEFAARLRTTNPRSDLEAKFSLPFLIAALIVGGSVGPTAFREPSFSNPTIRNLAELVHVVHEESYTEAAPARPTDIEIELNDGTVYSRKVVGALGDPGTDFGQMEVEGKFRKAARDVIGPPQIDSALDALSTLSEAEDICEVVELMTPPP